MSSTATTIQYLHDLEMARYRQLFHDMFAKVIDKVQSEVQLKLRQGIYNTMIRLPSVRAFSKLPVARTPPQEEIDNYVIAQLQKRDFVVRRMNENFIEVDWLHLATHQKIESASKKRLVNPVESIKHERPKHTITTPQPPKTVEPMLVPPRPLPKLAPPVASQPSKKPTAKKTPPKTPETEIPVLSNRVDRLDDRTEEKMATVHQAVLRALAGV